MIKKCSSCGKAKEPTQFYWKVKGKRRQTKCSACCLSYSRKHYRKRKKYYIEKKKLFIGRINSQVVDLIAWLKAAPCCDCGIEYPSYMMDFDHVRGKKRFNLGSGYKYFSVKAIVEEIHKCEIVCSNCHRRRTYLRRTHASSL